MKTLNELHAVKVVRTDEQGESFTSYLTYPRWVKSFVDERWDNERRYNKDINPLFGYIYHKNVVTDGFGSKSVLIIRTLLLMVSVLNPFVCSPLLEAKMKHELWKLNIKIACVKL